MLTLYNNPSSSLRSSLRTVPPAQHKLLRPCLWITLRSVTGLTRPCGRDIAGLRAACPSANILHRSSTLWTRVRAIDPQSYFPATLSCLSDARRGTVSSVHSGEIVAPRFLRPQSLIRALSAISCTGYAHIEVIVIHRRLEQKMFWKCCCAYAMNAVN